jgi:glyoxylase I family protein
MILGRLHHASFPVPDLAEARRFYGEVLKLEEITRPDFGVPGAWYRVGEGQVHLIVTPPGIDVGTRPLAINPLAPHTALAIDDYDQVLAHLRAHGVDVLDTSPAVGQMWVQDPGGNVIELIAPPRR